MAQQVPLPAPYGGMNTREGIAALQPHEARYLENWQPQGNSVKVRNGYRITSTGGQSANAVETLAAYNGTAGTALIGVNGGSIFDFTSATAILLSIGGYADNRFQTECYNNRLIGVNGSEIPWVYDGSTIAATGFSGSGLTITNLVNIRKVRNRLWFCEVNSADAWYGGLGSITGSLTKFQLSQVVGGGTLMAIGAHSQDAGAGPDDYTAFIMSTGEVVLYSGDPSSTFSKVGNYYMPPPVGRQCLVNIGGPLAVLTHAGLIPIQAAVSGTAFDLVAVGNYGKIGPTLKADVTAYGTNPGWQAITFEGLVIINVPVSDMVSKQRVYNFLTGAWTTWTGFNAASFCVQTELFFGPWDDGEIRQVIGSNDDGEPIMVKARGAFIAPNGGQGVTANSIRFDMAIDGTLIGKFGIDVDYGARELTDFASLDIATSTSSTPWGSDWGSSWSTTTQYGSQWFSTYGQGRSLALAMEAEAQATSVEWFGLQMLGQAAAMPI